MRRKKQKIKLIPRMTPFEKRKALDVKELFDKGINPLSVTEQSIGGARPFKPKDIAHYFELIGQPYDAIINAFVIDKETNLRIFR